MGHYYHALPVQGGLVVLEENLPNVIQDINRMLEYDSNTSMYLNPNNTSEAMETLRREGFFIHEMGYGVCLKGWGASTVTTAGTSTGIAANILVSFLSVDVRRVGDTHVGNNRQVIPLLLVVFTRRDRFKRCIEVL